MIPYSITLSRKSEGNLKFLLVIIKVVGLPITLVGFPFFQLLDQIKIQHEILRCIYRLFFKNNFCTLISWTFLRMWI